MNNTGTFSKKVAEGIQDLEATLTGSDQRVDEVLSILLDENKYGFEIMKNALNNGDWKKLRAEVHRTKPRYGYIGLDYISEELTEWESSLLTCTDRGFHEERFLHFLRIDKELKEEITKYTSGPGIQSGPKTGTRKKVLIAEDDEVNSMVFQLFIEGMGYDVILAKNGKDAVTITREENPDLIFMDVHMPYYSGLEAIKELRTAGLTTPIVSLSASTRLQEKEQSMVNGADDFMMKPAAKESIRKIIHKYLEK